MPQLYYHPSTPDPLTVSPGWLHRIVAVTSQGTREFGETAGGGGWYTGKPYVGDVHGLKRVPDGDTQRIRGHEDVPE